MSSYNYDGSVNSNLICCICRMPFLDPVNANTCFHTFCRECILRALQHSPHCPVDRSPMTSANLQPADPIVRALVDELLVECVHRLEGCLHTCQRQHLAAHLEQSCQYSTITCLCGKPLLRKDLASHEPCGFFKSDHEVGAETEDRDDDGTAAAVEEVPSVISCPLCDERFALDDPDASSHEARCQGQVVACLHSAYGCQWMGTRGDLENTHTSSCPYEAIKGFFFVHTANMSRLAEENLVLRAKLEAQAHVVQDVKREVGVVRSALGPWSRTPGSNYTNTDASSMPASIQPSLASTSRSVLNEGELDLASYFPEEIMYDPRRAGHRNTGSISQLHELPSPQTPVAPLNLSTTLEGSMNGLRESVVMLGASMDSLGRRNEIALKTEALRLNEEIMSLRANVHGLRLQVHAMMMDRNAQITGRVNDGMGDVWPRPPSITKL